MDECMYLRLYVCMRCQMSKDRRFVHMYYDVYSNDARMRCNLFYTTLWFPQVSIVFDPLLSKCWKLCFFCDANL